MDPRPIEIKIKKIGQLFNSFDPSPFLEKDLDDDAFEYIVSSVAEHPHVHKQKIVIHIPHREMRRISEEEIRRAIRNYFEYKKVIADRNIKLHIQEAEFSFVVGIVFLGSCFVLRELLIENFTSVFIHIFAEGLAVGGWVAMWKPISNVLYDWWPLRKEKQTYEKISTMDIEFIYS